MPARGILHFVNAPVRNQVQVLVQNLRTGRSVIFDCAGEALVEISAWVRQVRVDNLEPLHVDPVVVLSGSVEG